MTSPGTGGSGGGGSGSDGSDGSGGSGGDGGGSGRSGSHAGPEDLAPFRSRPEVAPDVLAVVAAAAELAWPRPAAPTDDTDPAHSVWRFSGRWWNRPMPMRRARPWTQR